MSGLPWQLSGKESLCNARLGFNHWFGKIPWRRKWQPTPVFLPGKSHGRQSLVGYCPWGRKESDTTDQLHFTSVSSRNIFTNTPRNHVLPAIQVNTRDLAKCLSPVKWHKINHHKWTITITMKICNMLDFPDGSVVNNPPTNARDTGDGFDF